MDPAETIFLAVWSHWHIGPKLCHLKYLLYEKLNVPDFLGGV